MLDRQANKGESAIADEWEGTSDRLHLIDMFTVERKDKPQNGVTSVEARSSDSAINEQVIQQKMKEINDRDLRAKAIEELTKEGKI